MTLTGVGGCGKTRLAAQPGQRIAEAWRALELLGGGGRRAIPRHQTLLASMDWSHARLGEQERVFFRRLAVFSGTFTLDAAAAICVTPTPTAGGSPMAAPGPGPGVAALWLLGRLVDTSLVTVRAGGGPVRYRLLDTIRQYAGGAAAGQVSQRLSSDFSLPGQPGYETAQKMRHSYGNGGQPPSVLTVTACLLRHVVRPCGRGLATPWKVDPDNVMLAGECPDHRAPRGATLTGAKPQAVARQAARECAIGAAAGQ